MARRGIRNSIYAQGIGRHDIQDIYALGAEDIETAAALLADMPYFGGEEPREIDAIAYAFMANLIVPPFDMPLREVAMSHENLCAYVDRMAERVFPELAR